MLDIFVFISMMLLLLYIGWRNVKKVNSETAYLLANRSTGLFSLTATLVMTEFNPSTLIGFSAAGYVAGLYALFLPFVFFFGLGFYTISVAKKWKQLNGMSVAELFTMRYGKGVGRLASVFLLLAMLGFSANYIKSLLFIFHPIFPFLSDTVFSLVIVLTVLILTLRGGLFSIISTDVVSFIATLIIIPLIFYFSYESSQSGFQGLQVQFPLEKSKELLPPKYILSLILLTTFTYIAAPWYGQKIFSAKNEKTAFMAVGLSAILVFFLYSFPLLSVSFLKLKGVVLASPDLAFPYIIKNLLPDGLRGFSYALLFAAGITTLSGVWSAMVTMIIADFLGYQDKEARAEKRGIYLTLIIAVLTYLVSITFIDRILDKLILANIPVAALSFSLLAGF
ncbi:MAG: hypothetical protein KDK45_02700, partial [Leptospiraceae bacterium]|nr:hypothetical protein [Leptospiraceae bacterium]